MRPHVFLLVAVTLASCRPSRTSRPPSPSSGSEAPVVGVTAPPSPPPAPSPARTWHRSPYVLRCGDPFVGCEIAARIRRDNGAVEPLDAPPRMRRPQPILLDDERVYLPGRALRKRDLTEVDLDWPGSFLRDLAQDADQLVVVDATGVWALPKNGSPRRILSETGDAWEAATGPFVAWLKARPRSVGYDLVLADHGGVVFSRITETRASSPRFDGEDLYWFDERPEQEPHQLMRSRQGQIRVLLEGLPPADELAFDETHVYWLSLTDEGRGVWRAPKGGGEPERLSISHGLRGQRGNTERLVLHGDHLYWNAGQSVVHAPKTGGPAEILLTMDFHGDVHDFAVDDGHLYVTAEIYPTQPSR